MAVVLGSLTHRDPDRRPDCNAERNTNRHITERCAESRAKSGATCDPHSDSSLCRSILAHPAVARFYVRLTNINLSVCPRTIIGSALRGGKQDGLATLQHSRAEPLAKSCSDGIPTRSSSNHFQFARSPFCSAVSCFMIRHAAVRRDESRWYATTGMLGPIQ